MNHITSSLDSEVSKAQLMLLHAKLEESRQDAKAREERLIALLTRQQESTKEQPGGFSGGYFSIIW